MKRGKPTLDEDQDELVPEAVLKAESAAWSAYGDAVHGGRSAKRRKELFAAAMRETDGVLALIIERREAKAAA